METLKEHYKKNLEFWETAWSRVKKAVSSAPDLGYIPEIPVKLAKLGVNEVIDLACGSGWLSFLLAKEGFNVTGVDVSDSAIKLANQVLQDDYARENLNVKFIVGDIVDLRSFKQSFDAAILNATFEHFDFARARSLLKDLKQLLRPNAYLYGIYDKVGDGNKGEFVELADGTKQYIDPMRDGMFLRYYTNDELKALFAEFSYKVVSWQENEFGSRIVILENTFRD